MSVSTASPFALSNLTERAWSDQLFANTRKSPGLARQLGWDLAYHVHRADRSPAGYPDWTLVRERIVFAELKRQPAMSKRDPTRELASSSIHELSDLQREWLDGIARAGGEAYVWVPSDLDEIARILGKRWTLFPVMPGEGRGLGFLDLKYGGPNHVQEFWKPGSMWIPGEGRADGRRV